MRRIKNGIGILLIIVSIGGLIFWEGYGRDEFMTKKVLAASETIMQGTLIKKDMFTAVSVLPESLMEGVIAPNDFYKIEGKEAAQLIVKNQPISASFLREPARSVSEDYAPYVIKGQWIDSRSSSLRKGDMVRIYSRDGSYLLGDFEIVFVKDVNEKEVSDVLPTEEISSYMPPVKAHSAIPDRTNSNGVIDHIEILTGLEEYRQILQFVENSEKTLLIVQRGEAS